MARGSSVI